MCHIHCLSLYHRPILPCHGVSEPRLTLYVIVYRSKHHHFFRKKLFSAIHYFVHLNLAISLLLGYLAFVLGIELGNSNKVSLYTLVCLQLQSSLVSWKHRLLVGLWQHCCSICSSLPSAGWCVRGSCSTSCWLWSSVDSQRSGGSLWLLDTVSCLNDSNMDDPHFTSYGYVIKRVNIYSSSSTAIETWSLWLWLLLYYFTENK